MIRTLIIACAAVLTLSAQAQSQTCPLSADTFPAFAEPKPVIPHFDGRDCSVSGWKSHIRDLQRFGRIINAFDDARLAHDRLVRRFDRDLQNAMYYEQCSQFEYTRLTQLILDANATNAGERKDLWWELREQLNDAIAQAQANILRLSRDLNAQCAAG